MKDIDYKTFLCPHCRSSLLIEGVQCNNDHIERGRLVCNECKCVYPIINYIPRFVKNDNYSESFGLQWQRYGKIQLDKYTGCNFSRERLFSVTGWPSSLLKGETVLEVGSGAGRFTQILIETGAKIFSFDYSKTVDANLQNNGCQDNLYLFQGDLYHIPSPYGLFDKIICLGVLQHTPNPKQAFMSLVPFLCKKGELVIDIYKKTLLSMLHWKYILRPITKRVNKMKLLSLIERTVPILLPLAVFFRKVGGPIGARILPIPNYSHLGISNELNKQWSILDTFDMYSPAYDYPQTIREVKSWFKEAGFRDVDVRYGPNGIIGKGVKG